MSDFDALAAQWFDGRSARPQACRLQVDDGKLWLQLEAGQAQSYPLTQVQWPERTRHGRRQIVLPDGGVLDLPDARAWDAWALRQGLAEPMAVRWAASWRWVLASLALLVVVGVALWRWGIPAMAEGAVRVLPPAWEARIGERAIDEVEGRWLKPSKLPAAQQRAIADAVTGMVSRAYSDTERPIYRLHLRDGGELLGPNAFALPGGDIVITDALVKLLPTDDGRVSPALLGVVAHELGHVRERHGMKMLFKAGLVGLFTGLWIGDYSSVLATLPAWLAQADYSREAEREADAEALRVMRAAGIDPREMVRFFTALKRSMPKRDGDSAAFGLASHPADRERIRFFEQR